jgi:transcriptional regulator with XRE-family HTH domain
MLTAEQIAQLEAAPLSESRNRVKRARDIAKLQQLRVCRAVGLSQPYLSAIERGDYRELPLETCRSLSGFYGCAIEVLFPAPSSDEADASQLVLPMVRGAARR